MTTTLLRCENISYVLQPYNHNVPYSTNHKLHSTYSCRQVLIQHGSMLRLRGQDIVHYFHKKTHINPYVLPIRAFMHKAQRRRP
jgi:hypothetical protein